MTKRPSQNRPAGFRKKVCPLGGPTGNATPATSPPVSELESPKLKNAGYAIFIELMLTTKERIMVIVLKAMTLLAMAKGCVPMSMRQLLRIICQNVMCI